MIVTDPVVYMQNRKNGIEHEVETKGKWFADRNSNPVNAIEKWCKEGRIRVKQKDIDPELAREAVELLADASDYLSVLEFDSVGIQANGHMHDKIKALLSKLKESER